jgi:hypothetical protein
MGLAVTGVEQYGIVRQRRFPVSRQWALRPKQFPAAGAVREKVEEIQTELLDDLRTIDDEVQALVWRRQAVVAELRRCRDALSGAPTKYTRRVPLPGDVDAEPEDTRLLTGTNLREAAAAMVRAAARPVTVTEIHRMLLANGMRAAGRYAKAISDALRAEVAAGRVVKVYRGVYAAPQFDP